MRTGGDLFNTLPSSQTAIPAASPRFSTPATIQRSPWHSPVPYLLGGLAAMLGIISFALLILCCSYWNFSSQVNSGEDGGNRDVEGGTADAESDKGESRSEAKALPLFEEILLVTMAGNVKPTFLATPMSSRSSSSFSTDQKIDSKKEGNCSDEKIKEENREAHESQLIQQQNQ